MKTLDLLKDLSQSAGPSGREISINQKIASYWKPLTDDIKTDAMGNLIAVKRGSSEKRRSLMLAAHMDEIGLIVTGIVGEFLRVHSLGGTDSRVILGSEVIIHGRQAIPGIIGTRPPHTLARQDQNKIPPWHEIFVDVGLSEDSLKKLVRVGDHITLKQSLQELKNKRVAGKAMDNRASVVAITLTLQLLQQHLHSWDVVAVATVQEEVGLFGAVTSAYSIAPDIAVAIDGTFAKQYNDSGVGSFDMDKGPTIGLGPNLHPDIVKRLKTAAETNEIPVLIEPLSGSSGTDAWAIQVAREGIPTGLLSIPMRYMHQPVETVSLSDIERTGRLLCHFIADLEPDYAHAGRIWMPDLIKTLAQLSEISGVSGHENSVRSVIKPLLEGHVDQMQVDSIGNLITYKQGTGKVPLRLMITAHMDEVGLMVVGYNSDGTLRVETVGGIPARTLPGLHVQVGKNHLPGVIGIQAIHRTESAARNKASKVSALAVDIGTTSSDKAESIAALGTSITFVTKFHELEDTVYGKAFDDRVGCAILLGLYMDPPSHSMYLVSSPSRKRLVCVEQQ